MKKSLRNLTLSTLLLAAAMLVSGQRAAAAPKPALTIAFAGYEQLINDLKAYDKITGHTKLAAKAEAKIELQLHGKGLEGLDKSRPWGVLVSVGDDGKPSVQGFLPVIDLKKLIAAIPAPGGTAPEANGKGIYEYTMGDRTIFVKQKGQWAVFADNEDGLDSVPEDPAASFSDLTKKYLLAVRGSVQNVPEATRAKALKSLRGLVELTLAMQQAGSEQAQQLASGNIKQIFEKLEVLSKQLDTLVIGIGVDSEEKSLFLDFEAQAVEGSDLAKKFAAMKDAKTDFAGFAVKGAALSLLTSQVTDDEDVETAKATLANYKSVAKKALDENEALGDKRDLAKKLLDEFMDVIEKTVELKKTDGGLSLLLGDAPAIIAGGRIAAGDKLESTLKKLVKELSTDEPKLKEMIKLDAEKYEGVNFHVATLPVPDPKAQEFFGDTVKIVIGLNESSIYFGAGKDPLAEIKKAIDASKASPGKPIQPGELIISGLPIAKFIEKVVPDDDAKKKVAKAAAVLAKAEGKDHITCTTKPIPNGETVRLNVETGVLQAIADLIPAAGGDSDEN